jgi:hypothetical protein
MGREQNLPGCRGVGEATRKGEMGVPYLFWKAR